MRILFLIVSFMCTNTYLLKASCQNDFHKENNLNQQTAKYYSSYIDENIYTTLKFKQPMLEALSENNDLIEDINAIMKSGHVILGSKEYFIVVKASLQNKLMDPSVCAQFSDVLIRLKEKKHSDKTIGYTFSYSDNEIDITPFLGANAR